MWADGMVGAQRVTNTVMFGNWEVQGLEWRVPKKCAHKTVSKSGYLPYSERSEKGAPSGFLLSLIWFCPSELGSPPTQVVAADQG